MIPWMLEQLERDPHAVFTQRKLGEGFPEEFQQARQQGLVRRVAGPPSPGQEGSYRHPSGGTWVVVAVEGGYEAFDDEDPENDAVIVEVQDLILWTIDLESWARAFQEASGVHGRPGPLNDELYFLGERLIKESRTAVVLGLVSNEDIALRSLRSLSSLISEPYDWFLVVCPSYAPTPSIKRELSALKIQVVRMNQEDPLILDLKAGPRMRSVRGPRVILTEEEENEVQRQGFNYRLPLHITAREKSRNGTEVLLDGNPVVLPLAPFRLFLWIVGGLFQAADGFVAWEDIKYSTGDLREEGIVPDGLDQALRRLRERFESPVGSMLKGTRFIEQKRRRVRLSTHKGYVTYDLRGLLTHPDSLVRELATRLPDDPEHNVEG